MTTAVSRDYAWNARRRTTRHLPLKSDLAIQCPAVLGLREVASTHRPRNKVEKLTVGRGIARSDALRAEALERDTLYQRKGETRFWLSKSSMARLWRPIEQRGLVALPHTRSPDDHLPPSWQDSTLYRRWQCATIDSMAKWLRVLAPEPRSSNGQHRIPEATYDTNV
jgi:hypothetical protein